MLGRLIEHLETWQRNRQSVFYFGGCPVCHEEPSRYCNVGRTHFMLCEQDKVAWEVGENLFSSWRYETQDDWDRNVAMLNANFQAVDAWYPEPTRRDRFVYWVLRLLRRFDCCRTEATSDVPF
jgi:hypothetical protein